MPRDGAGATFGPAYGGVGQATRIGIGCRSEEHTSELQSRLHLVCRLLLEKKKKNGDEDTKRHRRYVRRLTTFQRESLGGLDGKLRRTPMSRAPDLQPGTRPRRTSLVVSHG